MSIRKISLFVGLPIAAVALALFVMSLANGATKTHAAAGDAEFKITSAGGTCDSNLGATAKCFEPIGVPFTVTLTLNTAAFGWAGYDANIGYSAGLSYVNGCSGAPPPTGCTDENAKKFNSLDQSPWPACAFATGEIGFSPTTASNTNVAGPGTASFACADSQGQDQTYTGPLATLQFVCDAAGSPSLTLRHGAGVTDIFGSAGTGFEAPPDEVLPINCVPATSTPTTPPTGTPPPQPRVQKVCSTATPPKADTDIGVTTPLGTNLCNHFLEREGAKIPPLRCEDSNNQVNLEERINIPISSQDPKDSSLLQQLAAFEFEVRFDEKLVCVSMVAGPAWTAAGAMCSTLNAEGIVRFGCVTVGKGADLNDTVPDQPLAIIQVRPSEELVNILRPNQDNGIPVQIMNQGCELADEQGHVIPIFSCEDLDITFRFLEGDVDGPDCDVDITDAQNVAFRWGANQGSLLYNTFMDLEPSGQVKGDGDIDIKDLQFVFGRMPSTCANPWPPQPPVNPKA